MQNKAEKKKIEMIAEKWRKGRQQEKEDKQEGNLKYITNIE